CCASVIVPYNQGGPMQIVSGEIRTEIGAVSEDRAVFHQPIAEKYALTSKDVGTGKQQASGRINNFGRERRFPSVRAIGQEAQNQEAKQEDYHYRLNPRLRN